MINAHTCIDFGFKMACGDNEQKSKGKIKTGSEQTQTSKTITGRVRCHGGLSILSWKAIIIHGIFVQKQTNKS